MKINELRDGMRRILQIVSSETRFLRNQPIELSEGDAIEMIRRYNYFDKKYNPEGIGLPHQYTKEAIKVVKRNQDKGTQILTAIFENGKDMEDLDIKFIQTKNPPIGYIRVEPEETLGHYGDWLQIRTQRIRDWNSLSFSRPINLNQRIKLVFNQVSPDEFNRLRLEYHRGIEEDFFMNYDIIGTVTHQVQTGDNLWYLCHYEYNLPYWLVVSYNKNIDFNHLKAGDQLTIPEIRAKGESSI